MNDNRSGQGTFTHTSGNTYEGQFVNNMFQGHGIKIKKRYTHIGEYFENKRHGHGRMNFTNGDTYEGQFKDNVISD